jgi:hypothetical protein
MWMVIMKNHNSAFGTNATKSEITLQIEMEVVAF